MKKLFCILLSCILVFNSVSLVYADADSTARSSFNPYEQFKKNHPNWFDSNGNYIPSGNSCLSKVIAPALIRAGETSGEIVSSLVDSVVDIIKGFNNSNGDVSMSYDDKGVPVTAENYNENNFYLTYNNNFCNYFNQQMQDKVHALNGYYLYEPAHSGFDELFPAMQSNFSSVYSHYSNRQEILNYINSSFPSDMLSILQSNACTVFSPMSFYKGDIKGTWPYFLDKNYSGFDSEFILFMLNSDTIGKYNVSSGEKSSFGYIPFYTIDGDNSSLPIIKKNTSYNGHDFYKCIQFSMANSYGYPFRVFYSLQDLKNYLNNGKQRTYAPKLPSGGLKVPITYIQNNVNLPDLNINLDSLIGKAELDIQADIDLALKNYFDSLLEINNNPTQPAKPTPTPDGGFTDGTTPTPTPPITDGGDDSGNDKTDFSKITDLLQKILDKLTEFSSNHDTLAKTITDYIEKNDGKLDEIIVAINALADGKTEEEKNGCKYDFTALSEFMTTLWNESDKKFDKMVELLEENNKYQQKLVNSLNEIKALLVTQTIMDLFKDRSSETANKAKDKFPTSIPWDIALVLNSMSAEPEQLKFSLPIKIDSFKINETIDIDLSSDEWEKLATTCRYILSITFILFLIHLSRKLFSNGGDE